MNLRTRYKRLKQYVDFAKFSPDKVFFDRTNLEHFRCKANSLLSYGKIDSDTDEHALRVAKGKLKN